MKNVIELIRVSTEQQAGEDRAGLPAQREVNRRTARVYGLNIVRSIEIVDVSGAAVLNSPEMQELLRLMECPDIHGVVAKEFSRLIRPEKFTDYALLQHFIDTQTVLYLPDGPIDLSSKTGRFLGTIRAAVAGMERREIIERMMDAKESMRRAGKHPGGEESLPFGVGYSHERGWFFTPDAEKVREAFRVFLGGDTSYTKIGEQLNMPRTTVRYILENPIYGGWRVYDEKRDPSPGAYVPRSDGRQGYRRKMKRAPDEVIRVRVLDGLVSDEDFARVQQLIDLKRHKHWRTRQDTEFHYTYNGFLTCGECGSLLYTYHTSKDEFYQCKSRNVRERKRRCLVGLKACGNRYMLRRKLEPKLDYLFAEKLTDADFLAGVVEEYNERLSAKPASSPNREKALTAKLSELHEKRGRVLEAFFDGVICKEERERRLGVINGEIRTFRQLLVESAPPDTPRSAQEILAALEPLTEWEFLERDDKRALLSVLCPEISVFQYTIKSISLNLPVGNGCRNEVSQLKKGR